MACIAPLPTTTLAVADEVNIVRDVPLDDTSSVTLLKTIEATQEFEELVGDLLSEGDGASFVEAVDGKIDSSLQVEIDDGESVGTWPDSPSAVSDVFSDLFDARSECSYGTHLTTPSLNGTPLHTPFGSPRKAKLMFTLTEDARLTLVKEEPTTTTTNSTTASIKSIRRRSKSIGDFRTYLPHDFPTSPKSSLQLDLGPEEVHPSDSCSTKTIDPFAQRGSSYYTKLDTNGLPLPPALPLPPVPSSPSSRWLAVPTAPFAKRKPKMSTGSSTTTSSVPPTSFPHGAAKYAQSLSSSRRGTETAVKSHELGASAFLARAHKRHARENSLASRSSPSLIRSSSASSTGKDSVDSATPSSFAPGHRRRTSSLTSIDSALRQAANVTGSLRRAMHLRAPSGVSSILLRKSNFGPSGAPPSMALPSLPAPPSLLSSRSSAASLRSRANSSTAPSLARSRGGSISSGTSSAQSSLYPLPRLSDDYNDDEDIPESGPKIGRDRDLLLWREATAGRRTGFILNSDADFANLRLAAEDSGEAFGLENFKALIDASLDGARTLGEEKPKTEEVLKIGTFLAQPRAVVEHANRKRSPTIDTVEMTNDLMYRLGRLDDLVRLEHSEKKLAHHKRRSRTLSWVG